MTEPTPITDHYTEMMKLAGQKAMADPRNWEEVTNLYPTAPACLVPWLVRSLARFRTVPGQPEGALPGYGTLVAAVTLFKTNPTMPPRAAADACDAWLKTQVPRSSEAQSHAAASTE